MAILKATKKPVTIQCIQLTQESIDKVLKFIKTEVPPKVVWIHPSGGFSYDYTDGDIIGVQIQTLEGPMVGKENDYIIKGVKGEFYACDEEIFLLTYDIETVEPKPEGETVTPTETTKPVKKTTKK